jgi:tetratricopeptide (TPR) repeat protein
VEAGNIGPALQFLTHEWPNLRAAFSWATNRMDKAGVDLEEDCELILDYCFVLFHLFTNRFMFSEGLSWMEAGRNAAEEVDNLHELALIRDYCGVLNVYLNNDEAGRVELEAAIAAFRELNEAAGVASSGYHLGLLTYRNGDLEAAQGYFEEILPIMRSANNRAFAAQASTFLGQIYLGKGEAQLAHDTLSEAISLYQEDTFSVDLRLNTLFGLARAALLIGNEGESLERVNEAVSVAFAVSPRMATAALPNILQMAETYLSHEGGTHFAAFADDITALVSKLKAVTPKPEIAKEWAMTCHLMARLAQLLTQMVPASGAGDTPETMDELRPAVIAEAKELDTLSGGILGVEAWINAWLSGAARVGG